jgi:glycosyltransferase involved in cell wall biosynthesis
LIAVVRLLRKNNYDVIHAHWIIPQGLVAALACVLTPRSPPILLTSHGGDLFALRGGLSQHLKRWITGAAARLTVVSSAMKAKAAETGLKPEKDIEVIPMGVDAHDTFTPPPTGSNREGILFVGRLVEKKGLEYLIEAMPGILKEHPGTILTVIGDGPLRPALEERSRRLGIALQVKFLGPLTNTTIPDYLKECAVAVFPSVVADSGDQEGAPVAIMEAQACECATIVADYPGAPDLVIDGQNGFLVQQKSAADITEKANRLLADHSLARQFGTRSRQHILEQTGDLKTIQ